ncbi:MAG TPA: hypothetical protein DCQ97_01190 [Chitinophagaceae bacterium]|nr:hypothetical protein [Chitinophagaceae bacterium]
MRFQNGSDRIFDVGLLYPDQNWMVFRGAIGVLDFETGTTEVMAVSDFDANILRFSENANLPDRNFTVFVVKTLRLPFFLNGFQMAEHSIKDIFKGFKLKFEKDFCQIT